MTYTDETCCCIPHMWCDICHIYQHYYTIVNFILWYWFTLMYKCRWLYYLYLCVVFSVHVYVTTWLSMWFDDNRQKHDKQAGDKLGLNVDVVHIRIVQNLSFFKVWRYIVVFLGHIKYFPLCMHEKKVEICFFTAFLYFNIKLLRNVFILINNNFNICKTNINCTFCH